MYKKILVPLDGSQRAEAVLRHVEDLALRFGAKVVFLRAVEPASPVAAAEVAYATLHRQEFERQVRDAEAYLRVQQGKFRALGIDVDARVSVGSPVDAIVSVAEREDVDLVAMASQGRSAFQVFYDSVSAGVLQRIQRPLLVVRGRKRA